MIDGRVVPGPGLSAARVGTTADPVVAGITVTAEQNGVTIDSTITDAQGLFELAANPGRVTLRFTTEGVDVSVDVTVPEGSTYTVTISITVTEANVEDQAVTRSTIDCQNGSVDLDLDSDASLVVNGNGGACIQAGGNCTLHISAHDVTLKECGTCVEARGASEISITASGGELVCESSGEGIDARGTSRVELDSAGALSIESSAGHGISATGNASVDIASPDSCMVHGGESAIDAHGSASVNSDGCESLDTGGGG